MLINYMVNAFLRECNFSRHNFYFVGTMRNVSFQIIVRHKMHFPKIPVNKCMFRSAFFIKHSRLYVWYLTSITHQPKWSDLKSVLEMGTINVSTSIALGPLSLQLGLFIASAKIISFIYWPKQSILLLKWPFSA